MKKCSCKAFVATLLAMLATASFAAGAQDKGMGTWKLNLEKSTFNPGPPPQSIITRFEPDGDGVKWRAERTLADGKSQVATYNAKYDGKDYPLTGSPTADTITLKRIDAHTTERVNKKGGKVGATERRTVAADGKSYVTTVTGTTADGQPVSHRLVFDKQ